MDSKVMETDKSSCSSQDTVTNGAYPVRCTEELLLPFITDESLQVAMKPQPSPSPRPADRAPVSPLPELRLVLLGRKGAGKSAAGNTVLGGGFEAGKPTEECVKRRADVAGRKVMVVDTPGWDWYYPLNSTPNWVRRETLRSVSLCPPGPHAVLLVVRSCASVNEDYITEIGEHLELLGTKVWEHTMVLFTRGDELGLVSMEQRIQTSGPGLQTLLQKCGNRYHVVENRTKGDGTQVKELVRKLEEMVAEKEERWKHLEMDAALLLELEADGKRRARERRKKQRQMEAQVQRGTIKTALMSDSLQISESDTRQSFSKTPRRLPEVRLVLLGERETGKSSAGNAILGQSGLFESGTVTEECVRHQAAVSMRLVTVVDTPGWDRGVMGSTPERVKREIVSSVALCPPGPHALLVTIRVDTVVRESHVREHLELLGEDVWRHTILLFTHGDQLREGIDIEQHIQKGGKDLQSLLEKCRGRYHMISSFNGLQNTRHVTELLEKVEEMAAKNRCEAFSGLVQEVKTLSHQRNEKFNQRFKELQDKMQRQEEELKNMRDREIKSLRWFFDRRKKVKSPGNLKKEEEDDEEKRSIDRKYDIEELEERMRLLTEDKEREIQDLNVEHERILAALHQSRREAEEVGLNLELKEREIEELQERIDEQQLKLIDLERIAVGHERERKRNDEAVKEWEKVVHKLQQNISLVNAEWKERVDMMKAELDDARRHFEGELERTLLEKNIEMSKMEVKLTKQTETMLTEKDKELEKERKIINEEKQRALDRVKQKEEEMQRKLEEMTGQHQKEIDKIKLEMKEEMDRKIQETEKTLEMAKVQHMKEVETNIKWHHSQIKEKLREQSASQIELKQRELDELEQKYLEIMKKKLCEHEKEKEILLVNHTKAIDEKDKEMSVLKEQLQEEIREKSEVEKAVRDETASKVKEKEDEIERLKEKHAAEMLDYENSKERCVKERDREIEKLKCRYMFDINEKNKELEQERKIINEEKQRALDKVKQKEEEMQRKLEEMTGQHQKEIDASKLEMKEEMDRKIQETEKILEMAKVQHMKEVETNIKQHHSEIKEKLREIETLKEQSASQIELKQRELDELEQKYLEIMKEKLCEHEKEKEILLVNHKKAIDEKDKEIKEKLQKEMTKEKYEVEKAVRDETASKVKEKEDEIERLKEKHAAEMLEYENSKDRCVKERDREIEDLKCRYMFDINKKDKELEQILTEKAREVKELKVVVEELKQKLQKQMVESNCISAMQTKLENRATQVTELKECLREKEERWRATEAEKEQEKKQVEQKLKEKEWIIQQLHHKLQDIEQMLQEKEDERGQILLNQKKEAELQLQLRDKEMDEMKRQLVKETERYVESVKMIEKQTREIAEAQRVLALKEAEFEEAVKTQEKYVRENEELQECVRSYSETEERYRNREAEMMEKIQEKDKDLDQMRLTIEQTKAELNNLTQKMEREMTKMIQEYERGIERRNKEIESFVKDKEAVIKGLEEEQRRKVLEVTEKYEESQKRIEELEIKTTEGIRELQTKCEQLREECEEKEQQVQIREREIENICKNNDREVLELGERNKKLQTEIEMFEKEMSELKEQLKEKELEVILKDDGIKEGDLAEKLKEIELWEKKKQEFERKVLRFDCKQEELKQREIALEAKENERDEKDRLEQERRNNIEQKEKELEELLKALEAKQTELNFHGQDLQKKVRGLKDQGKELNGREVNLRKQEQELMNWTSELNVQNEQVSSTTQQLDEMGRDLALLKEELRQKEKKLKLMSKNLNKWETSLQEREAELSKRQQSDSENVKCGSDDEIELMYQDIGVEKETGKDRTREDQSAKMAEILSAKDNHCHFETLQEIVEQKEGGLRNQESESVKVIRDFKVFAKSPRNYKESGNQVLTVLMLRESWSSCSPTGVSLLGAAEASELNGSSFRSWKGQIAGRRVSVVEPLGLKWRDGPGPNPSEQSQNILKAVSWCESGPDVVLLVTPAFLTCTEMYRNAVEEQARLVGNEVWKRTMVLFTWGQTLGVSAEQHIRGNGELRRLIDRCGGRFHVLGSKKSKLVTEELFDKMDNIVALNKRQE